MCAVHCKSHTSVFITHLKMRTFCRWWHQNHYYKRTTRIPLCEICVLCIHITASMCVVYDLMNIYSISLYLSICIQICSLCALSARLNGVFEMFDFRQFSSDIELIILCALVVLLTASVVRNTQLKLSGTHTHTHANTR